MSQGKKEYLLQLSIGPVQEFIAAARRTRDLWFGSHMLSEISKAAAKSIKESGAELIFPNPLHDEDLDEESSLNVANVILAKVSESCEEPDVLALRAKEAAQARFEKFAAEAYKKAERHIESKRWNSQIADVVEFYEAWVELDSSNYKASRQKVARLLAARKNLRDFKVHAGEAGVPKSSLDGLRESVFKSGNEKFKILGVRIKKGEALDTVGLIKRVAGDEYFPSVSRVAVDPWVRGAKPEKLEALKPHCEELVRLGVLSRAKGHEAFPYEGTALLPSRYGDMISDLDDADRALAEELCKEIIRTLGVNAPLEPYFVLLVADGDKMGKAISRIDSPEVHRDFSGSLSEFAGKADEIVKKHSGVCVYTGGDDVLAFLPLDKALRCSRDLHESFGGLMKDYNYLLENSEELTLSVGLSIAHAMEDLEELLAFGRGAEKVAKTGTDGRAEENGMDRNGLAITVRSRGGSPIAVRERWKADGDGSLAGMPLDKRMELWALFFMNGSLPNKFPYELRENAHFYKGWAEDDTLRDALRADAIRIFNRKDVTLSDDEKKEMACYIKSALQTSDDLEKLSSELVAAQWIAFGMKQAKGGK